MGGGFTSPGPGSDSGGAAGGKSSGGLPMMPGGMPSWGITTGNPYQPPQPKGGVQIGQAPQLGGGSQQVGSMPGPQFGMPRPDQIYDLNEGTQGQPYTPQQPSQQQGDIMSQQNLYNNYATVLFGDGPSNFKPDFVGAQQAGANQIAASMAPQQQFPVAPQPSPLQQPSVGPLGQPQQGIGQMGMTAPQLQQQGFIKAQTDLFRNSLPQQMAPSPITQASGMTFPTAPPPSAGNPNPIGQGGSQFVGGLPTNTLPQQQGAAQLLAQPAGGTARPAQTPANQMNYAQLMATLGPEGMKNRGQQSPGPIAPQLPAQQMPVPQQQPRNTQYQGLMNSLNQGAYQSAYRNQAPLRPTQARNQQGQRQQAPQYAPQYRAPTYNSRTGR